MSQSLVRHFMSESVKTITPDTTIEFAARRMYQRKISCLVVCQEDTPVGIVTERDITRAYAYERNKGFDLAVQEIMSDNLTTLSVDATCAEALDILKKHEIRRCVLVDENGDLKGIVTQTDLLRAHALDIKIQKEILEDRVRDRTKELEALNERFKTLSLVDPLLNIGNRRAMNAQLDITQEKLTRQRGSCAIALIDVDDFKSYNDHYGHLQGDQTLKELAITISDSIRVIDSVYRYGGEEFLIIFDGESIEDASISAERVRQAVAALNKEHVCSKAGHLTISIGVAAFTDPKENWEAVIKQADEALYKAKDSGKNRTEISHSLDNHRRFGTDQKTDKSNYTTRVESAGNNAA